MLLKSHAFLYCHSRNLYFVYVDTFSVYDVVQAVDVVTTAMHAAGGPDIADQSLIYIAKRLKNWQTFLEYNKIIMAGIQDRRGLEQGGLLSSSEYQLVSNAELNIGNESGLGVQIVTVTVEAVGAADDTVLLSNFLKSPMSPQSIPSIL